MPEGYDGTARPWYKQAAQAGAPVLTPAYVDATTGKLTITFAEPVGPAGQPTAVVGTDMHLDTVTKKVAAIRPISKSFAFLIDGVGGLSNVFFGHVLILLSVLDLQQLKAD